MTESAFQARLIKTIRLMFDGAIVLKNDAGYLQGFPDLMILWNDCWAVLECKASENSSHQPNQDYYIDILNQMSFARFIYPSNRNEVLSELEEFFKGRK